MLLVSYSHSVSVFPFSRIAYLDCFRLVGGRAQSTANLVEGLACCLQFFDDIKGVRENGQKYCVLICNSPPNMMPVMENDQYAGNHLEQLASLFGEVSIVVFSVTREMTRLTTADHVLAMSSAPSD